ncbi:hypothetical protein SEA_LOZINAK_76 [Gordonia phage Lozinak]|uniref:Uncharacterized protein n=4 Tax=Smoothievirus TaxID=1982557 RepID=A0A2D1GG78_9CAUD|nr:hypothetical protein BEN60_gp130 [Gordonia phage Smoothie]YP_009276188.1 hypothetical protein BH772_gp134 [Gordonia phage Bachita]YP_009281231.1 hypothetical protein BIZ74_gp128 [Gordonia phage Cucurbita]ATN90702.1 hypothetical protein SEA_LOZINAK_76 [Gordonia phage Lozinak]AUE23645.1 hypothetical protein SEA_TONIANN_76 [Gordonia phage Toniann]QAU06940.1 hypothetical protein SEA_APHELION_75 [Gordonia phage Aphelion]QKY79653.1 hypothetical protein SEA_ENGINEER_77 [Gordonia Phage Engineer]Q
MTNPVLKTSEQWSKEFDFTITDPDGWDRKDFLHSWHREQITKEEFIDRAVASTVKNLNALKEAM